MTVTVLFWQRDLAFGVPGEYALARCQRCGLLHQNPRVRAEALADCYPDDYPRHTAEPELSGRLRKRPGAVGWLLSRHLGYRHLGTRDVGWSDRLHALLFRARILGAFPPWRGRGRLLDVGCGSGRFLRQMKAVGWEVTGIEVDEAAATRARTVTPAILVGDLSQADLPAEHFDCITALHVVEHLPDPVTALRKMLRWLAPGGVLVIEVPNAGGIGWRWFGRYWASLEFPRHLIHFTPATMAATVERAGGRIVAATHRAKPRDLQRSLALRLRDARWPLARALETTMRREPVRGALKLLLELSLPVARWLRRGEATRYFIVTSEMGGPDMARSIGLGPRRPPNPHTLGSAPGDPERSSKAVAPLDTPRGS